MNGDLEMQKLNQKKALSAAITMLMTFAVCGSVSTQASDIEIYSNATAGQTSIMMMLDTSGSMGISSLVLPKQNNYGSPGDVDKALCDREGVPESRKNGTSESIHEWIYNLRDPLTDKTATKKTVKIGNTDISYYVRGCTKDGVKQYDRLSRLKDALLPLLAADPNNGGLKNNVVMGLGHFSAKTKLKVSDSVHELVDGHSGTILVPNAALDTNQRILLAQQIAAFKSLDTKTNEDGTPNDNLKISSRVSPYLTEYKKTSSGTPTAHAYAEAAAYMMGTNTGTDISQAALTKISYVYDGYMLMQKVGSPNEQAYFICVELGAGLTKSVFNTSGVNDVKQCVNNWPSYDKDGKVKAENVNNIYKDSNTSGTVYNSDGQQIIGVDNFKAELKKVGVTMGNGWDTLYKLPEGWRYGGWMRVNNEPLDIEPVVGTVWGPYANDSANGIVSYRTNPFALVEQAQAKPNLYTDNLVGGMRYSVSTSMKDGHYIPGGSTNTCDGNGIYVLTDGAPNSTKKNMAQAIMNTTLNNNNSYKFNDIPSNNGRLVSPPLKSGLFTGETGGWEYIGEYAKKLFDKTKNPGNMSIKTAVVGFGSSFAGVKQPDGTYNCEAVKNTNPDAYNACKWGGKDFGNGGFYYAENSDDIRKSILEFVSNVTPPFDPIATGSPTLPQDALNPLRIQPYGYYASFTPKPQEKFQLWVGNLNKYHIYNGELFNTSKTISLIKSDGSLDSTANGLWAGGMKEKLPLGLRINIENEQFAKRTIYTNRKIIGTAAPFKASEVNSLKEVNVATLFGAGNTALFVNDPDKNYWLNLLGYNVGVTETGITLANLAFQPELRQVGAVMHSTPILLTQRGKINVSPAGALDTRDRDDYLLFGSTQGLLHVVDVDTGVEKFAFAPHEMMQNINQKTAFLSETSSTGGSSNLFYGIDAPWTAYTQYVSKNDGTLTVNNSDRTSDGSSNQDLRLKGLQWVYGGLRMGGRSYYALDLSNLDKPSLKFHIDPDAAVNLNTGEPDTSNALSYMGQSWSKPTLAYVKFGGVKKLVMFVGGGYDKGYENAAYDQSTTIGGGAGVYMFSAGGEDEGKLLWWSSAYATAEKGAGAFTNASNADINMKYSVVSQINAIDRDNDGLVDNLYFGDLGGQAFRIDLNNSVTAKNSFATRVVRLFNEHASDGKSPRFYEMPSVSVHEDHGYVGAIAFSSGNRSSPLVGAAASLGTNNQAGSTVSAADGVFVVYDKDVAKSDLYTLAHSTELNTNNVTLTSLNTNMSSGVTVAGNNGWKYIYSSPAGVYKGMNELYAVDGMLYVNVYHRDGAGIGGSCGAGVKGDSYVYQFCLPSGKCSFNTTTSGVPNRVKLGVGILGAGLGQGFSNANNTSLVVKRPTTLTCTTTPNLPECQEFTTTAKLTQLRWYETR